MNINRPVLYPPVLVRIAWRYLLRHPWQSVLMVIGVTLGVAVVVAIDLANASASRAFQLSTQAITGRATHQVTAGPDGLDESLYLTLKHLPGIPALAPVISTYVTSPQLGSQPLQLLGVDPFSEAPFRSYLGSNLGSSSSPSLDQFGSFLTVPGAVLLSQGLASQYGLAPGSPFSLKLGGHDVSVRLVGLLEPSDSLARRALTGLILADISTAQELTGKIGRLDRIDLILPSDPVQEQAVVAAIKTALPPGAHLEPAQTGSSGIEQMTAAFRLNLTALSLLALVVGLFLIYNTMTFSVVQRRPLFGRLRSLGITRSELWVLVVSEAFVIGILGSLLGVGLGIAMGQTTIRMILQTINDLYFTTTVSQVGLPATSLLKGAVVGVVATVATAALPAWEAAQVPPRISLSRASLESSARRRAVWAGLAGLLCLALGMGLLLLPRRDLLSGFGGTLVVVLGFALLSALFLIGLMRLVAPVTGRVFGLLGRMAPRSLVNSLSRTAVAVAALMIAVAVTLGVNLMIASFRQTVVLWLAQTLQGDVYITAPGFTATAPNNPIDPTVLQQLAVWPGIAHQDQLRSVTVDSPNGLVQLAVTDNQRIDYERMFKSLNIPRDQVLAALQNGSVIVSEPLANRLDLHPGSAIRLYTTSGEHTFPVVGVYYEYSSSQGIITLALDVYRRLWQDNRVTAIALRLPPGANPDAVTRALQSGLKTNQQLDIRPNQALRQDVMVVFDRTFAITGALQILATIVAFIGVLNSLLLLQLEKSHETGILRALGLTVRQMWGLVMLETSLMGLTAGLLAIPTGATLALILIYVINKRSFGWTLQLALGPAPFLQGLAVAVIAAVLAGFYPARKLGQMVTAEAIRNE